MMIGLIIAVCLALSFFLSGIETGVLLINRARIRHLKERGSIGAGILLDFLHRPGHLSSTVLVGNTVVNTAATVLVAVWFLNRKGPLIAIIATALFAFVLWFFGELVPKAFFQRFPNRLATRLAVILRFAYIVLWPLVQLFHFLSQGLIQFTGGRASTRQMFVIRDELKLMAREGSHGVSLTGEQRNLVASILNNPNATVKDVMQPKAKVVAVKLGQFEKERLAIAIQSRYSRLPIEVASAGSKHWEGLWVVYDSIFQTKIPSRNLPQLDMNTQLEEALTILRKAKSPFAAVRDPDGMEVGIVTVGDVLRRYFGGIEL